MVYLLWLGLILVAVGFAGLITRPLGAYLHQRDLLKRKAKIPDHVPRGTDPIDTHDASEFTVKALPIYDHRHIPTTRPTEFYTVWDSLGRKLTPDGDAYTYKTAHQIAVMYAVQWRETYPHQLPLLIKDRNGITAHACNGHLVD